MDVHFERVALGFGAAPVVELLAQVSLGEHALRFAEQCFEHGQFPSGQFDLLPFPAHDLGRRVVLKRTLLPYRLRLAHGAAHQCAQPGSEFVDGDGLDQIVVGAGVEPGDPLLDAVARSEDQDRQCQAAGAPANQPFHAIASRQPEIKHDRVERGVRQCGIRRAAVAEPVDRMGKLTQTGCQRVAEKGVIFDNQQSHGPVFIGRGRRSLDAIMRRSVREGSRLGAFASAGKLFDSKRDKVARTAGISRSWLSRAS